MRVWRPGTRLLALALLLTGPAGSAVASELLVMPYSCTMLGGRPLLTPSREQGHQIVGPREQRTFTACSPANPDQCRTWTVHRFALDCDGDRVPWISVVAAATSEGRSRRAWIEDGRLRVRMPPSWSLDPDDPCARRSRFGDGFGFGRMRRYCNDRRELGPPPIVDMPAGFAPMLGIDAFFVRATPGVSASPPVTEAAPSPPPVAANPVPPPPKVASAEPLQPRHGTPQPGPPIEASPAPKAPQAVTPPKETVPAPQAKAPQPAPAPKPAAPPAQKGTTPAPSGGPVVPKIINRTDTPAEPQATAAAETPIAKTPQPAPERTAAKEQPAPEKTVAAQEAAKPADDEAGRMSLLTFAAYSPAAGAFAAFMVLTLALVGLFAVARRREQVQAAGRPREVAAASLDKRRRKAGVPARPVALRGPPPQATVPVPPPRQPSAPLHAAPPMPPPALRREMPRTRGEAIEVLGMGVMPGASEAAMKKIVDGLRLSWHPDLAEDEADRQLRELRIKQINTAWDIIRGRQVEI